MANGFHDSHGEKRRIFSNYKNELDISPKSKPCGCSCKFHTRMMSITHCMKFVQVNMLKYRSVTSSGEDTKSNSSHEKQKKSYVRIDFISSRALKIETFWIKIREIPDDSNIYPEQDKSMALFERSETSGRHMQLVVRQIAKSFQELIKRTKKVSRHGRAPYMHESQLNNHNHRLYPHSRDRVNNIGIIPCAHDKKGVEVSRFQVGKRINCRYIDMCFILISVYYTNFNDATQNNTEQQAKLVVEILDLLLLFYSFNQLITNIKPKLRRKIRNTVKVVSYIFVQKRNKVVRKKISTRRIPQNAYTQDEEILEDVFHISEDPEIQLMHPPLMRSAELNVQDEGNRILSFRRRSELRSFAGNLARYGFFLNHSNFVECFSCSVRWNVNHTLCHNLRGPNWHVSGCEYASTLVQDVANHRQVESDTPGRISDDIGDPPGQQSIYIPPGDNRNEVYRLSTFEHFPAASPTNRNSLAKEGFYFTGFFDRVKCFACGRTVEQFNARDDPRDPRWHKPDCPLPRGQPCGNVPINNLFGRLRSNHAAPQAQQQNSRDVIQQQRDPNTGAVVRAVRYPADLPERIRRSGGTFQIGPNASVIIQSGLRERANPTPIQIGNSSTTPPRSWRMASVVSADHRRFLTNLHLNRELERLTSFARWRVSRPNVSPAALARSGFFYLGDLDRVQCFSCGGVLRNWTLEDDADEEHRTHFPTCRMVQGTEPRNVSVPEQPETPEQRATNYPCQYPANPHMRNEVYRFETFDSRWPTGRITATPAQIAEAGFFFLGERDRVKCWYCNGGLQNWEPDDVPWDEHAKWFPNCQFLLQNKGQVWVYRHLVLNPHLPRPIIARQEGSPLDPTTRAGEPIRPADIPPGGARIQQPGPPPTIIDPQEEMRKKKERIDNIIKNSEVVKCVLVMGFSERTVRQLLEEKIEAGSQIDPDGVYDSVASLLDDVMKKEAEPEIEEEDEMPGPSDMGTESLVASISSIYSTASSINAGTSLGPSPGSGRFNVSLFGEEEMEVNDIYESTTTSVTDPKTNNLNEENEKSLKEMLSKIEDERMCKVCFSNNADMVFIPCSHMCCCMECTQALRHCPICRVKIEKAIKTYSS